MALFRFHCGSLADSIKTTIIVKNTKDLLERLAQWWEETGMTRCFMYQWQLSISKEQIFDERCGWYSHNVRFKFRNSEWIPLGILSEPLEYFEAISDIYIG